MKHLPIPDPVKCEPKLAYVELLKEADNRT
jgi:hypothetical protein